MNKVKRIENYLETAFKDLPKIPKSGKDGIVGIMPWIALIFGVLQIIVAWGVWGIARSVDRATDLVNSYAAFYTAEKIQLSGFDRFAIYLGAAVLLVSGIIGLLAYRPLTARERRGWDLMFLAALVSLAYSVVAIFINGRGFSSFILGLVGSALGFYLLFQIKDAYTKKSAPAK